MGQCLKPMTATFCCCYSQFDPNRCTSTPALPVCKALLACRLCACVLVQVWCAVCRCLQCFGSIPTGDCAWHCSSRYTGDERDLAGVADCKGGEMFPVPSILLMLADVLQHAYMRSEAGIGEAFLPKGTPGSLRQDGFGPSTPAHAEAHAGRIWVATSLPALVPPPLRAAGACPAVGAGTHKAAVGLGAANTAAARTAAASSA
jgi:hypothetical protein